MGEACGTHGGKRNAQRILVWKPEGNKPIGITRSIYERIILKQLFKK
jgi:hypothetical protein